MKDKDALILENLYNKIVKEAILDQNGNPASQEYSATVDTQMDLPKDKSGFCLHNKSINLFAFENEVNMAIMISFVIYTIGKKWMDVKFRFDSFLQWVLSTDKKAQKNPASTEWKYNKGVYFADEDTPRNSFGPGNAYIKGIWEKKKLIYDKVIAIYHPVNNKAKDEADLLKKSIDIWFVLINNISGLGPTKAAFCVQLMMGKLGCIDSINSVVYQAIAPEALFTKKPNEEGGVKLLMKSAKKDPKTKELNPAGHKIASAYIEFLNSLEKASGLDISKNLWDVWCDIVAQKLQFAGSYAERKPIGVILPDKSVQDIMPYQKNKKEYKLINKYLEMLGGKVTGQDVSGDHADIITKSRERIGENINTLDDVERVLNILKENITKNLDRLFLER